jgi:hypothetical protein
MDNYVLNYEPSLLVPIVFHSLLAVTANVFLPIYLMKKEVEMDIIFFGCWQAQVKKKIGNR